MNQWKWLLISLGLVAAASVGLVGCGDDEKTKCTTNDDCGEGEICIPQTGVCETRCESTDDCEGDDICSLGCTGATDGDFCFTACKSDGDCSTDGSMFCDTAFCGNKGGLCTPNKACSADSECGNDQICDASISKCIDKCKSTSDCFVEGSTCNTDTGHCVLVGAGCTSDTACGEGQVCNAGVCEPAPDNACTTQADCYATTTDAYCAATSTAVNTCVDTSCGVAFNSCGACSKTEITGGHHQDNGPLIFAATQDKIGGSTMCQFGSSSCATDAPILCQFSFSAFSPVSGDLPESVPDPKNPPVKFVTSSGKLANPFGVKRIQIDGNPGYRFQVCISEGKELSTPSIGAVLKSNSGKQSNTLCTIGTKR